MQTKEEILKDSLGFPYTLEDTDGMMCEASDIYNAMEHYAVEKQIEILDIVNQRFFISAKEDREFQILRQSLTKQLNDLKR